MEHGRAPRKAGVLLCVASEIIELMHVAESDPVATQARYDSLAAYMDGHVLRSSGFCCASRDDCRGSVRTGDTFAAGQLSHVGRHYDLSFDGVRFRILVLGMDTGRPENGVTLEQRRQQVYDRIPEPFNRRNPHMRGTTLALRALLGREAWGDASEEQLALSDGGSVHLLDAYAMANSRLCSAFRRPSPSSKGTPRMSTNCLRHLRATVEILQPRVVVVQGVGVRKAIQPLLGSSTRLGPNLEAVEIAGCSVVLTPFSHPSYPGPKFHWSWPSSPYFVSVVLPTLSQARAVTLGNL